MQGFFFSCQGECRGLPPAMGTGIQLDTFLTLSLVLSQETEGKTAGLKAMKDKLQTCFIIIDFTYVTFYLWPLRFQI